MGVGAAVRTNGPTALILSRQNLDQTGTTSREDTLKGGYVAVKETGDLKCILIATGSELQHAVAAAKQIGGGVRVVSMPCMERFDRQSDAYKAEVLPDSSASASPWRPACPPCGTSTSASTARSSASTASASAPGDIVMSELGMTADNCAKEVKAYM